MLLRASLTLPKKALKICDIYNLLPTVLFRVSLNCLII